MIFLTLICAIISIWVYIKVKTVSKNKKIVIVLGSGGHSSEMIYLTSQMNLLKYDNLSVFVSNTDKISQPKFLYEMQKNKTFDEKKVTFYSIPRTNEVGESKIRAVFKTLFAFLIVLFKVANLGKIEAAIFNGPGVCLPIIIALFLKNVNLLDIFLGKYKTDFFRKFLPS